MLCTWALLQTPVKCSTWGSSAASWKSSEQLPWDKRFLSWSVQVVSLRTLLATGGAFPTSLGCFCAGVFNWGVLTSPHFESDSIKQQQQHPLTLPHWVSWWACARRFSWESCHSSLTLQWLFLGKLQTAAQWNDTVWFCVSREKQLWNFVKDP